MLVAASSSVAYNEKGDKRDRETTTEIEKFGGRNVDYRTSQGRNDWGTRAGEALSCSDTGRMMTLVTSGIMRELVECSPSCNQ